LLVDYKISDYIDSSSYFGLVIILSIIHVGIFEHLLGTVQPKTLSKLNYYISVLAFSVLETWAWFIPSILWTRRENNKWKRIYGWLGTALYFIHSLVVAAQAIKEKKRQKQVINSFKEIDGDSKEIDSKGKEITV
jgi:hypothetical protein